MPASDVLAAVSQHNTLVEMKDLQILSKTQDLGCTAYGPMPIQLSDLCSFFAGLGNPGFQTLGCGRPNTCVGELTDLRLSAVMMQVLI